MIFVEHALLVARIQSLKPYSPHALGTAELEFCFQAVYLSFLGISFCKVRSVRFSCVFIKTDDKIGIFKQNRENPDEIHPRRLRGR